MLIIGMRKCWFSLLLVWSTVLAGHTCTSTYTHIAVVGATNDHDHEVYRGDRLK